MKPDADVLKPQNHLRSISGKQRSIPQIAAEILTYQLTALQKTPGKVPLWVQCSRPYVLALQQCDTPTAQYGAETARSLALYALSNMDTWRGEDARRIKAELKTVFGID